MDYLQQLFSGDGFVPRSQCGSGWTGAMVWTQVASHVLIWASYIAIPLALLIAWRRYRGSIAFPREGRLLLFLFAGFIATCGATHGVEALIFFHPVYRLQGFLLALCAAISVPTAIRAPDLIRYIAAGLTHISDQNARIASAEEQLAASASILAAAKRESDDLMELVQQHMMKLEKSADLLNEFVTRSPAAIYVLDDGFRFVVVNVQAAALLGVDLSKPWQGIRDSDLLPIDRIIACRAYDEMALQGQAVERVEEYMSRPYAVQRFQIQDAAGRKFVAVLAMVPEASEDGAEGKNSV